ncbi:right-handed parallel beta-helix repeat-containing protein [Candidatus Woesearchaeota archaeon]|nr:right-handed parallel beta-helix repeat-containing protein [Candidatus Woesearchaeota archaeon]
MKAVTNRASESGHIWFGLFLIIVLVFLIPAAFSADPGHPASDISPGTFTPGNYNISGNFSIGSGTLRLFLDNSTGSIGIGTTSPLSLLHVVGSSNLLNVSSGDNALLIATTGYTGINTTDPKYALDMNGTTRIQSGQLYISGIANSTEEKEGAMHYDSDDDQLKIYANGKWQSDRSIATVVVAANDSVLGEKADYVADGLLGTDDSATIKTAIDSLPPYGGSVVLLEGTFYLESPLRINRSNFTLIGAGKPTVLLRRFNETTANNSGLLTIGDGENDYSDIIISDMHVFGDNQTNRNINNHGIFINKSTSNVFIKSVWVTYNAGAGILSLSSGTSRNNFISIKNSEISNNHRDGIRLDNNTEAGMITGNLLLNNEGSGIYMNYANHTVISGNYIYQSKLDGITLNTGYRNTIASNMIQANFNSGIWLMNTANNAVTGNMVYDNSWAGINLTNADNNTITGNVFYDNGDSGTYDSVQLQADSDGNVISSNRIADTGGTGSAINILGPTNDDNQVIGNYFTGTGATLLNDTGTNTVYTSQLSEYKSKFDIVLTPQGNVGFGSLVPAAKLHVNVTNASGGGSYSMVDAFTITNSSGQIYLVINGTTGFTGIATTKPTHTLNTKGSLNVTGSTTSEGGIIIDSSGRMGINNSAPTQTLQVNGSMAVCTFADASCPTTITAGDSYATTRAGGAIDVSEWIKYAGRKPIAGDVVCAVEDGSESGTVAICNGENGRLAVGIISTKPHMSIGAEYKGNDAVQLAITGRVPVNVIGEVEPGDLLVSAGNGKARSCYSDCYGSVIGKAMTVPEKGKVLALLSIK